MSENTVRSLVLVGSCGMGKSSTGNSIIGSRVFKAQAALTGVTTYTSDVKSVTLDNGQIINVLDTPGLFQTELRHDFICKEIVKCLDLAKGGIHALLMVISVRSRIALEDVDVLNLMMDLFGAKITDYMIVIMTAADDLGELGITHEDFLEKSGKTLKNILGLCRNRYVFFDNRTKDEVKKKQQVQKLLEVVDSIVEDNQGIPFTNDLKIIDKALRENIEGLQQEVRRVIELKKTVEASQKQLAAQVNDLQAQLQSLRTSSTMERAGTSNVANNTLHIAGTSNFVISTLRTVGNLALLASQFLEEISNPCSIM